MTIQPYQPLSKLDAATRQLNLAIDLFFKDADPIGVHTLASAAHGILRDLLANTGSHNIAHARKSGVEFASQQLVEKSITEAKNFLKHADRDPNKIFQYHPNFTDFLIFDAIRMHIRLARTLTIPNCYFLLWLSAKYPGVFLLDSLLGDTTPLSELRRIFPLLGSPVTQKSTFLTAMNQKMSSDSELAPP